MAAPSAQARVTLQNAFERFASTVAPDDKRLFHNTKLKDVRDEVMRIERQLRARRMQRNMARLDPFLRGMEHYSKVVEVLCNGTPYLSWIWAPMKLMLMITIDSIGAFEKLIEAYAKIGDMLPRLDRLGYALADDHNFQNVLALVYSDVIEFHRRAYKFVRKQSWAIFFGSMWLGFESRFNGILKNLAYHSELVDKEASAADIAEAFRRSKADDEKWEQQERERNTAKVHKVLSWLETNDTMPADILERHLQDYLPDSCDWFAQHKETQLWLKDVTKNPLLWLCGKPGAGKSVICSALVQHAEDNHVHVFYYFCSSLRSNADGPICRPSRLLRSIISQVIQKHQDLAVYVHDVYFLAHPVPTKKALMRLLPELLRGMGSVRLIVDGIDEWNARDQKDVLHDLSQIVSVDESSHTCKILVASRETIEISRSLRRKNKPVKTISLSNGDEDSAISRSIANFVESKLSDLPDHFDELDPDASIMACVKKTLIEKSHGMFLWVSLVLDLLDRVYSPEELRTIVDDLPSDLEKLYEKLFARLCSAPGAQSHGGVSRVMGLVCSVRRPLHKLELLQALSILPDDTGSRVQDIPVASILDHCKPLIEELLDSTIVPVHFSVKEYFLKSHKPEIISAIDSALDLSSACVVVITRSLDLLCPDSGSVTNFARIVSGHHRLLPYALEFWIEHCLEYASERESLGLDRAIQHHLNQLYAKHEESLHAVGCNAVQAATRTETNISYGDERLEPFSGTPVYGLMTDVLHLRRLASQQDDDRSTDIEAYMIERDRTLFSRLSQTYESAIVHLLEQRAVDGITASALLAFQESYASTAFRCRFPHCDRLSLGFATAESRLKHEAVHIQRLYCQTESCQYNRIGFANKSALNAHTRKHHSQSNTLLIPAKVRGTQDRSSASDVNADLTDKPKTKLSLASYRSDTELQDLEKHSEYYDTNFGQNMTPEQMQQMQQQRLQQQQGGSPGNPQQQMQQIAFKKAAQHMQTQGVPLGQDPQAYRDRLAQQYFNQLKQQQQIQQQLGLERKAKEADARRQRGEDLGPPPTPTPRSSRRYETGKPLSTLQGMLSDLPMDKGGPPFGEYSDDPNSIFKFGDDDNAYDDFDFDSLFHPGNASTSEINAETPMPEGIMGQQRGSPAPNMNFDPTLAPPGMPPQFYPQNMGPGPNGNPMMRPPSSHPNGGPQFNGQPMTQEQMQAMRNGQMAQNGGWRGGPQPGMMGPGGQQMGGPMGQNPQQRQQMPPPPAPTNEQPRPEPSPSVSNQAPPTPNQGNKANPKKKVTKDNKPANKKGNAGATPATSNGEEPPTPTSSTPVAPITPVHKQSFNQGQNGGPQQPVQPQPPSDQPMDNGGPPFGNIDGDPNGIDLAFNFGDDAGALENFDFDSFLHTGNDNDAFGNLVSDFDFPNAVDA